MDLENFQPANEGEAEEMNKEIKDSKSEKTTEELAMDEQIEHYKFFDESLIPRDVLQAMRNRGLRNE